MLEALERLISLHFFLYASCQTSTIRNMRIACKYQKAGTDPFFENLISGEWIVRSQLLFLPVSQHHKVNRSPRSGGASRPAGSEKIQQQINQQQYSHPQHHAAGWPGARQRALRAVGAGGISSAGRNWANI